jgi:hypothetical protein
MWLRGRDYGANLVELLNSKGYMKYVCKETIKELLRE